MVEIRAGGLIGAALAGRSRWRRLERRPRRRCRPTGHCRDGPAPWRLSPPTASDGALRAAGAFSRGKRTSSFHLLVVARRSDRANPLRRRMPMEQDAVAVVRRRRARRDPQQKARGGLRRGPAQRRDALVARERQAAGGVRLRAGHAGGSQRVERCRRAARQAASRALAARTPKRTSGTMNRSRAIVNAHPPRCDEAAAPRLLRGHRPPRSPT